MVVPTALELRLHPLELSSQEKLAFPLSRSLTSPILTPALYKDWKNFVRRLVRLAEETHTVVYAWALMITHAHLLVCSGPAE